MINVVYYFSVCGDNSHTNEVVETKYFHIAFTDPSEETTLRRDLLELHQLPKSTQPDPPLSSLSIYIKLQHYLPFLFNNEFC